MAGIQITDEDRKKIDGKFICTVCNLLLCMPMQTSCGHLMCCVCLQTLLKGSLKCPTDGSDLVKEKVFPDASIRSELKSLHLNCPNPGCCWYGLYEELQEHVDMDCEATHDRCRRCQAFVLTKDVREHEQSCHENSIVVRNDHEQEAVEQQNEPIHYANLLLNFVLNCVRMGVSNAIFSFMENIRNYQVEREMREARFRLLRSIRALEVEQERKRILEKKKLRQDACIQRLSSRLDWAEASRAFNEARLNSLQRATCFSINNGVLLWKIDGFQRKLQGAASGAQPALYSPPFYSSHCGYKMCVKLYPYGTNGPTRGSHMSLFFVLMKGEYDALLTFPLQAKVTMMLLDQPDGDHIIDVQNVTCAMPTSGMNVASGSSQFMPIAELDSRAYVQDDVMFIKVKVEVSPMKL